MKTRKSLCFIMICAMILISGCSSKNNIFQKEDIRFFPSALYAVKPILENNEETEAKDKTFTMKVEFMAKDVETVQTLQKDLDYASIIKPDGTKISAATKMSEAYRIKESLEDDTLKYAYGYIDITMTVPDAFISEDVRLVKKDGSEMKLDSRIRIDFSTIPADTYVSSTIDHVLLNTQDDNLGASFEIPSYRFNDTKMQKEDVFYSAEELNLILQPLDNDGVNLILNQTKDKRTMSLVLFIKNEDQIIPIEADVIFEVPDMFLDLLS